MFGEVVSAIRPSLLTFTIVDVIAVSAYLGLPNRSAELALSNNNPLGIATHIFSHVSTWHVVGNAAFLLAFPLMLSMLGYVGATIVDQGEGFLNFINRWTVPLFFVSAIASGTVVYFAISASDVSFTLSGMSDGVYGVATGLAFFSFLTAFTHTKLGRLVPTGRRILVTILFFYVFYSIISTSLDNLGHLLGVLSGIVVATAVDVVRKAQQVIVAIRWRGSSRRCGVRCQAASSRCLS